MTYSRSSIVFSKDVQGFLKKQIFGSIFSLKLSLMLVTVLKNIQTLISYCIFTLNVFCNKKNFDVDKKNLIHITDFWYQIEILLLNLLKLLKIPGFLFKTPGFTRFFQNFLNSRCFQAFLLNKSYSKFFSSFLGFQVK